MSWKAAGRIKEITKNLTRSEKFVLLILADYHNEGTRQCDPSAVRLAQEALMSERHLSRILQSLEAKGFIQIQDRRQKNQTNQYDLLCLSMDTPPDMVSGGHQTQLCQEPTGHSYVRQTVKGTVSSSEDSSEEESSSSAEEEEDFQNQVTAFYSPLPSSRLRSPIHHPSRYFKEWQKNGDSLPIQNLEACKEVADVVCEAVNVGHPDTRLVTLPHPLLLCGLAACLEPIHRYALRPQFLRLALYSFTEGDGVDPPELSGADVLERMAKRPDLFAEALRQQSDALG